MARQRDIDRDRKKWNAEHAMSADEMFPGVPYLAVADGLPCLAWRAVNASGQVLGYWETATITGGAPRRVHDPSDLSDIRPVALVDPREHPWVTGHWSYDEDVAADVRGQWDAGKRVESIRPQA